MRKFSIVLHFIIVICLSVYLGTFNDIYINNFSDLISQSNYLIYIWSIICSLFTCRILYDIDKKRYQTIFVFISLNMVIFFPYDINNHLIATIHILIAYFNFGLLTYLNIKLLYFHTMINGRYANYLNWYYLVFNGLLIYLFSKYNMVNSLFEITFTLGICLFLLCLYYVKHQSK